MRRGEGPEALGKTSTYKTSTRSLEYVEVGPFNHSVVLRNTRQGQLMNNAEISTRELKLGGIVRIEDLDLGITKEVSQDSFGFVTSFVKYWEESLDLGEQVFNDYGITVTCNALHATVLRDQMVSSDKL